MFHIATGRCAVLLAGACVLAMAPTAASQNGSLVAKVLEGALALAPSRSAQIEDLSKSDWEGIREAYEAGRHAAYACDGGLQARNPGNGWSTRFDGRGFLVSPDEGDWTWGLEFEGYGFEGGEEVVGAAAGVSSDGGLVTYCWGPDLDEWYINDRKGLEHGFTLRRRPTHGEGSAAEALNFTLSVRGPLLPDVTADGRGVNFLDEEGALVLTYTGLLVVDARGRELDAEFERIGDQLRLSIDERRAEYPLTIDPTVQQAYLKASNTDAGDWFGSGVSISGDTVVVGAVSEDSNASGVNGNQANNSLLDSGAAYVFVRDGTTWTQEAYLKASNPDADDWFGWSVAISGDTVVVGAYAEDSNATGVDGDQSDDSLWNPGAAYVFVRDGTTWSQEAYLKASNTGGDDSFGWTVAASGDYVVVGALYESGGSSGVNGPDNNLRVSSGAAYVFARTGTTWSEEAYLKASNTGSWDQFGFSVAVSGDTVVVGARSESSNATGVNGNQGNNSASNSGASYVFVRGPSVWSQEAYLKASNTDVLDSFGSAVAISDNTIAIGALEEDGMSQGVGGDESNNGYPEAGAVYVFVRNGTDWAQEAYVKASNTGMDDRFGSAVAVAGDVLVVGASQEDSDSPGVNGNQLNNNMQAAGAAYVFVREGATWIQQDYLKASNTSSSHPQVGDYFGFSVSVSGDTAVAGAIFEDSSSTGVNGVDSDDSFDDAGAAYVFDLELGPPGVPFCFGDGSGASCPCFATGSAGAGCPSSSTGGAILVAGGTAQFAADTFKLNISGIPGARTGLCVKGSAQLSGGAGNPVGDGLLCVAPQMRSQFMLSDAAGDLTMDNWRSQPFGSYPSAANVGGTTYYQWWYRDTQNACSGQGFNFSNAWSVTWH